MVDRRAGDGLPDPPADHKVDELFLTRDHGIYRRTGGRVDPAVTGGGTG